MRKRKVSRNAQCPCESGKKYKDCCITKRFQWLVDENGIFYRSMKMHPEVAAALRQQERRFVETFGRKPRKDDPVFLDMPSATEVGERMEGTAGAVAWVAGQGAHIVRVHDVKEMVRVVRVVDAITRPGDR